MDLIIKRKDYLEDGIFGAVFDQNGNKLFSTLEHAYLQDDGTYAPKVPDGFYVCIRGFHRLEGMSFDFPTYEITNVVKHTEILFHWGNYNKDSAGCVLLGQDIEKNGDAWMITDSRKAFAIFMQMQNNLARFNLRMMNVS